MLLVASGIRRTEATDLNVSDVDLSKIGGVIHVRDGKNHSDRHAVVEPEAALALERLLDRHPLNPRDDSERDGPLFTKNNGRQLTPQGIGAIIKRIGEAAGIELADGRALAPHQMRHTWADAHFRNGTSEAIMRQLGGWSGSIPATYGADAAEEGDLGRACLARDGPDQGTWKDSLTSSAGSNSDCLYTAGTLTVMSLPSPACRRQRPGRGGCPRTSRESRTPIRSPSGVVDGAVRQPRRARLASTCQPVNQTPMLSASPARTRARPASPPRVTRRRPAPLALRWRARPMTDRQPESGGHPTELLVTPVTCSCLEAVPLK
jgi:Phage integrase family